MKKIIYSLVIMIAAGSLFTSCIDQVEPVGILDMRTAKAEYIRALKDLRAADAEYRRAEAAVQLANAAYRQAETAWMQEQVNNQKLLNELQALKNEAEAMNNELKAAQVEKQIADLKNAMEVAAAQHEINMVNLEKELAKAEESLRVVLRNIALAAQDLTADEKVALTEAVALYRGAYELYLAQSKNVIKAQVKVDTLSEYVKRFTDTAWNGSSLVNAIDYWNAEIAKEQKNIEKWKKEQQTIPAYDADLTEWKNLVKEFVEDTATATYDKYVTEKEIAQYYTQYVHDGGKLFNQTIDQWVEDNKDIKPEWPYKEVTEPDKDDDKYKTKNDTIIAFPALLKDDFNEEANFNTLSYLLTSYKVKSPVSKLSGDAAKIIRQLPGTAPEKDTLLIQKANQSMKAFILGAEGDGDDAEVYKYKEDGKDKEIKADYGLKGALAVMKRVFEDKDNPLDTAVWGPEMRAANAQWAEDRAVLEAGLNAYQPFVDSLQAYKDEYAKTQPTALLAAMKNLYNAVKSIDGVTEVRTSDSTVILSTIEAYAKARDEFFGLNENFDKKYAGNNPRYFYFKYRTVGSTDILDSTLFSAIATQTTHPALAYEYVSSTKALADMTSVTEEKEKGRRRALQNIISQLFANSINLNTGSATVLNLGESTGIMSDAEPIIKVGTTTYEADKAWDKATKFKDAYEPAAFVKARTELYGAIAKYFGVYNNYFGTTVGGTDQKARRSYVAGLTTITTAWTNYVKDQTAANLKSALVASVAPLSDTFVITASSATAANLGKLTDKAAFSVDVFKPFTKEDAPLVTFAVGSPDATEALVTVLKAVDPAWTTADPKDSFIFNGGKTDFFRMMRAQYYYWAGTHAKEFEQDTKVIEDWIADVEAAFVADEEKAGKFDEAKYNADKAAYDKQVEVNDSVAVYNAALVKFVGADEDGDPLVADPTALKLADDFSNGLDHFYKGEEFVSANLTPLADWDGIFDVWSGEWTDTFAGELLEKAKAIFPELPTNLAVWQAAIDDVNDELEHAKVMYAAAKSVLYAKAEVDGYTEKNAQGEAVSNFDDLVKKYQDAYNNLKTKNKTKIEGAETKIENYRHKIATFKSGKNAAEAELEIAKIDLAKEQARLEALQTAVGYAKANLEHLIEYLKSQDVNYVIPVSVADIAGVMGSLTDLLDDLGINVGELIAAYMTPSVEAEAELED